MRSTIIDEFKSIQAAREWQKKQEEQQKNAKFAALVNHVPFEHSTYSIMRELLPVELGQSTEQAQLESYEAAIRGLLTSACRVANPESKEPVARPTLFESHIKRQLINDLMSELSPPSIQDLVLVIRYAASNTEYYMLASYISVLIDKLHKSVFYGYEYYEREDKLQNNKLNLTEHETNLILGIEREMRAVIVNAKSKAKNPVILKNLQAAHLKLSQALCYKVYDLEFFKAFWNNFLIKTGSYYYRSGPAAEHYKDIMGIDTYAMVDWMLAVLRADNSLEKQRAFVDFIGSKKMDDFNGDLMIDDFLQEIRDQIKISVHPKLAEYAATLLAKTCPNYSREYKNEERKQRKLMSIICSGEKKLDAANSKMLDQRVSYLKRIATGHFDKLVSASSTSKENNVSPLLNRLTGIGLLQVGSSFDGIQFFSEALHYVQTHENYYINLGVRELAQFLNKELKEGKDNSEFLNHIIFTLLCAEHIVEMSSRKNFFENYPTFLSKLDDKVLFVVYRLEKVLKHLLSDQVADKYPASRGALSLLLLSATKTLECARALPYNPFVEDSAIKARQDEMAGYHSDETRAVEFSRPIARPFIQAQQDAKHHEEVKGGAPVEVELHTLSVSSKPRR